MTQTEILEDEIPTSLGENGQARKRGRPPKEKPSAVNQAELVILCAGLLRLAAFFAALGTKYPVLLMSPKEANDIAKPLARIIARSKLMQAYGKHIVGSSDYIALILALYHYGDRVWSQTETLFTNAQRAPQGNGNGHQQHSGTAETPTSTGPITTGAAGFDAGFVNLTPGRE